MNQESFVRWEEKSKDTLNFKTIYIDMTGDLVAGLMLGQIVSWHLPRKSGTPELRAEHGGHLWVPVQWGGWWEATRLSEKQAVRAGEILLGQGLIARSVHHFKGVRTTHLRLEWDAFLGAWSAALQGGNRQHSAMPIRRTTRPRTVQQTRLETTGKPAEKFGVDAKKHSGQTHHKAVCKPSEKTFVNIPKGILQTTITAVCKPTKGDFTTSPNVSFAVRKSGGDPPESLLLGSPQWQRIFEPTAQPTEPPNPSQPGTPGRSGAPATRPIQTAPVTPAPASIKEKIRSAHDPEHTREILIRALGGEAKLSVLMGETPPGLRPGQRQQWTTHVSPERAEILVMEARAGAEHPWSHLTRLLDGEMNPALRHPEPPSPGGTAYLTPKEQDGLRGAFPAVSEGEVWQSKASGKAYHIEEITASSVFVREAGEFPRQQFHNMFVQRAGSCEPKRQ